MNAAPSYLLDQTSSRVAALQVSQNGDFFTGTISLEATPPGLLALFRRFEELVEGQVFPLADEVEEAIGLYQLRVLFDDGTEAAAEDLEVYPTQGRVAFRACLPAIRR